MARKHPYQCMLICKRAEESSRIMIGASGSHLYAFNIIDGSFLSSWPSKNPPPNELIKSENGAGESMPRPPTKRKASSMANASDSSSAEIVVDHAADADQKVNAVIKLTGTKDGRHIISTTSEDKCIRVFEVSIDGRFNLLSERLMPKRPCAVILTPDESTILCADKFGDVYSMPLWGKSHAVSTKVSEAAYCANQAFVPSASAHTVHTKRNREALKQQQNLKHTKPEKKSLNFENQLLLGHVSLLTDLVCVSLPPKGGSQPREFILTSDRDEHIRVSRNLPQAHIIQTYCLGHTQFVSKLCILQSKPNLMVSGGGDDFLIMWDWLEGHQRQRIDLLGPVTAFKIAHKRRFQPLQASSPHRESNAASDVDEDPSIRIAVSGIWSLHPKVVGDTAMIVTCQAVPALFLFELNDTRLSYQRTIACDRNILDVVLIENQDTVIVTVDNIHEAFSTSIPRDKEKEDVPLVARYRLSSNSSIEGSESEAHNENLYDALAESMSQNAEDRPTALQSSTAKGKSMQDLLYGLEGLRKRGLGGDEEINTNV